MRLTEARPRSDTAWARFVELRGLLDEVADIDLRNPLWLAVIGSAAAALGRPSRDGYLASDAEPRADTFMGWPEALGGDLPSRVADAILIAHAAVHAIAALDGELPDQPLARSVLRQPQGAVLAPVPDLRRVAFAIGERAFLARLGEHPADDTALAAALVRAAGGAPADAALAAIDPRGPAVPAAIAVAIGDDDPATARHLHRRAWSRGGGPWLGLGRAGGLSIVSTCHLVVDGYGHGWLTSRIAAGRAADARAPLEAAARAAHGGHDVPALPAVAGAQPLGVAWRRVAALPRFPVLAHALGRVLHADENGRAGTRSPTFQVPVAPGDRDDPMRRRRRVVPALVSVRFPDGQAEPVVDLAARVAAIVAREAAGAGLMSRLLDAARSAPAPLAWKRRVVGSASRPLLLAPITRVLGGRACLSLLRLGDEALPAPPLVAVSSPGLLPSIIDAAGSTVVTAIADDSGATITASGCGRTGDAASAEAFLDRLLAALRD